MTVVSYIGGQKYYPINYDLKSFFFYLVTSILLFGVYWLFRKEGSPNYLIAVVINMVFLAIIFFKEKRDFIALFRPSTTKK
jgi:hypothetical protein